MWAIFLSLYWICYSIAPVLCVCVCVGVEREGQNQEAMFMDLTHVEE